MLLVAADKIEDVKEVVEEEEVVLEEEGIQRLCTHKRR
jgi:hypothetical protein